MSLASWPTIEPGAVIVAYLREPRERIWGVLLRIDVAGVILAGIDLRSFDDWLRAATSTEEPAIAPSTAFYPLSRVERILLDEAVGAAPSLDSQCIARTGRSLRDHMQDLMAAGNPG